MTRLWTVVPILAMLAPATVATEERLDARAAQRTVDGWLVASRYVNPVEIEGTAPSGRQITVILELDPGGSRVEFAECQGTVSQRVGSEFGHPGIQAELGEVLLARLEKRGLKQVEQDRARCVLVVEFGTQAADAAYKGLLTGGSVTAKRQVVDLEGSETATRFSEDFISDLPVPGRYYRNVINMAPGPSLPSDQVRHYLRASLFDASDSDDMRTDDLLWEGSVVLDDKKTRDPDDPEQLLALMAAGLAKYVGKSTELYKIKMNTKTGKFKIRR